MQKPKPILITDLCSPTLDALSKLLVDLRSEEWEQLTVCDGWAVKDVSLHLLAVDNSNLSRKRDGFSLTPKKPIHSNQVRAGSIIAGAEDLSDRIFQMVSMIA